MREIPTDCPITDYSPVEHPIEGTKSHVRCVVTEPMHKREAIISSRSFSTKRQTTHASAHAAPSVTEQGCARDFFVNLVRHDQNVGVASQYDG